MKFEGFQVTNFRNVIDSGWINANQITAFVGQNEAGKSNLFEALYCVNPIIEEADYNLNEDWPVDKWEGRKTADGELVCHARFQMSGDEAAALAAAATKEPEAGADGEEPVTPAPIEVPSEAFINPSQELRLRH